MTINNDWAYPYDQPIRDIVEAELQKQRESIVEMIKEMRDLGLDYYEDTPSEEEKWGFNYALDNIIKKIGVDN